MISQHIQDKLKMFSDQKYKITSPNESIRIKEKKADGRVDLQCVTQNCALVFDSPEKNVLPYLDEKKKGARACSDAFIFTQDENENSFNLHLIEFKKTINTSVLDKAKWQLTMGFYNARAIAGFLGLKISDVYIYSGYRNDEINDVDSATLIQLRASNNMEAIQKINDWKTGKCKIYIDGKLRSFDQGKIKLDDKGCGSFYI